VFGESSSDEFSETEISEDDDGQSVAGPVFSDVGNESFMTAVSRLHPRCARGFVRG
jgi:hypothetical protein